MKTIIIRKADFRSPELWEGILRTCGIPDHTLDGQYDDLTLSISKSSHLDFRNTEVIKCYE